MLPDHFFKSPISQVALSVRFRRACLVTQSCLTLCDPWTVAHQAPLSMEFSRQEYWSGSPFLSLGDLPTQGWNPDVLYHRQILYRLSYQGRMPFVRSVAAPRLERTQKHVSRCVDKPGDGKLFNRNGKEPLMQQH